jgi:enterochelin esterase-like enzyme
MNMCTSQSDGRHVVTKAGVVLFLLWCAGAPHAQSAGAYQDLTHPSAVFGHEKSYRLYLPEGYESSERRYPVVYFFHGWGGRHFKDDNARIEYEKLKSLVDRYQVIMVMWDGNIDEKEPRPYNIGNHQDVRFQVQMCDYFRELVAWIDSHYRTLTDRNCRGIIGFSMGGFMSFFIAGKFPDMVSSAVSLAGSPEFFVGYPENHTLYPVRYAFRNLQGVHIRLHNGDTDILYYLNTEVRDGALWDGIPLDYWQFHGGHMVDLPGETKVFESALKFTVNAFHAENPHPRDWTHLDLYPVFDVWGYHVETDKKEPGFTEIGDVDRCGFFVRTLRWLPDGPPLRNVQIGVRTPALYVPRQRYDVISCTGPSAVLSVRRVMSDAEGRLWLDSLRSVTHLGIYSEEDLPQFVCLDYTIGNEEHFLSVRKDNRLHVRLFNRGGERSLPGVLRVTVNSGDPAVAISGGEVSVSAFPGRRLLTLPALCVSCAKTPPLHASPAGVKLRVTVSIDSSSHSSDFTVPVSFDVPFFQDIRIDDGMAVRERPCGRGDGDGVPDAGEYIMLYQGDRRLRLYSDDPWILKDDERLTDEMIPAIWADGYTLSSVIHVSPGCPDVHRCECLARYESKSYSPIERTVVWGKVRFTVRHR